MRRHIPFLAAIVCALTAALPPGLAQTQSKQKQGRPPLGIEKIAEDLFVIIGNGGKEVRARYFGRGHTNGDVIVYFPAQRTIHTGDLMAGVTPLIDYDGGGSVVEWVKTIDAAMAALDFDQVIPGHGTVTNRAGLQTYRDNVVKMRDGVAALVRQGKSQEEVRAFLAGLFPTAYTNPNSMQNQWSLPGFMTELK